jgi:hypothetical protein
LRVGFVDKREQQMLERCKLVPRALAFASAA